MRQMRGRHTRARATPKFEVHLLATHKLVSQLAFQLMSDPVIATPITQPAQCSAQFTRKNSSNQK